MKKFPVQEPLKEEKRYVTPQLAHVSVFTGLFSWAMQQNRSGKRGKKKPTLGSQTFGTDGIRSPSTKDRNRATFSNYFSFGTQQDLKPMESDAPLNVHRNRLIFLAILAGVVIYTIFWMMG